MKFLFPTKFQSARLAVFLFLGVFLASNFLFAQSSPPADLNTIFTCSALPSPEAGTFTGALDANTGTVGKTALTNALTASRTFTATCVNNADTSISNSASVVVSTVSLFVSKAGQNQFISGPFSVNYGEKVDLKWISTNANGTLCSASGDWGGGTDTNKDPNGSTQYNVGGALSKPTYTFTLTCTDNNGSSASPSVTVTVNPPTLACGPQSTTGTAGNPGHTFLWGTSVLPAAPAGTTYTYTFTGDEGLSGSNTLGYLSKTYNTYGNKSASVTMTATGGRTIGPVSCGSVAARPDFTPKILSDNNTSHPVIGTFTKNPNGTYVIATPISFTVNPQNIGASSPSGFNVKLQKKPSGYADSSYSDVATASVGTLSAGAETSAGMSYTWTTGDTYSGGYAFRYCVDFPPDTPPYEGAIKEINEGNNCSDVVTTVPSGYQPGTVSLKVRNTNTGPSGAFVTSPLSVNYADKVDLQWTTTYAASCNQTPGSTVAWTPQVGSSGTQTVANPLSNASYSYNITCRGLDGVDVTSNTVVVNVGLPTLSCGPQSTTGTVGNPGHTFTWGTLVSPALPSGFTYTYTFTGDESLNNTGTTGSVNKTYTIEGAKSASATLTATGSRTVGPTSCGSVVARPDFTPANAPTAVCSQKNPDNTCTVGFPVTFTVTPKNQGASTATAFNLKLQRKRAAESGFSDPGNVTSMNGLAAGASANGTISYTLVSGDAGNTEFRYCVDFPPDSAPYEGAIKEIDEGNNCSGSVTLSSATPVATNDIKANSSDGPITVNYGAAPLLSWTSTNTTGCSITANPALSGFTGSGLPANSNPYLATPALTRDTTFTLNCSPVPGASAPSSDNVTVKVLPQQPTVTGSTGGACGGIVNLSYIDGANATSFSLYRQADSDTSPYTFLETAATLSGLRTADSGLSYNRTYFYQVKASNANGDSYSLRPRSAVSSIACFDYSLSNGGNISVIAGQSITNSITRNLLAGATQSVTLSLGPVPKGVTGTFTNNPANPTAGSTLTLNTTLNDTSPGTYLITVNGLSSPGNLAKSTTFNLTVTNPNFTLTVSKAGTGLGTVTVPSSISCGSTCSASYPYLNQPTLTASPSSGSTFAGWSGACSGSASTCTVTMDSAKSVTATFTQQPSSATLQADNTHGETVPFNASPKLSWTSAYTTGCSITASPALSGFSGGGLASNSSTYLSTPALTGDTTFTLTCTQVSGTSGNPTDSVLVRVLPQAPAVSATTGSCGANLNLSYTASANTSAYKLHRNPDANGFAVWGQIAGGSSGVALSSLPTSQTVNPLTTYQYQLEAVNSAVPSGASGAFSPASSAKSSDYCFNYALSNGGNISVIAGQSVGAFITKTLLAGATQGVTLSLGPLPNGVTKVFSNDPSNPTSASELFLSTTLGPATNPGATQPGTYLITVNGLSSPGNLAKSTTFNLTVTNPNFTLTVSKAGTGLGTVTVPSSISCGSTCSASYPYLNQPTLTASPSSGSTFAGWSGACSGSASTCTVTMDSAKSVTATFTQLNATLTMTGVTPVAYGAPSSLSWNSNNMVDNTCSITPAAGFSPAPTNLPANKTNYPTPNLTVDTTFTITCTQVSGTAGGNSATAQVKVLPQQPSVTPSAGACGGNANLSYGGGLGGASFSLYRQTDSDTSPYTFLQSAATLSGLRATDTGLTPNRMYFYQVSATNAAGTSYSIRPKSVVASDACFDYSLTNSGNVSLFAGQSVTNTITKTLLAGATQAVTLSVGPLPNGVTATFTNNPSNPTSANTLTLSTTLGTTLPNTYLITVNGAPSGKVTTFNLTVTNPSYTLTVNKAGTGSGTVTSAPSGISCGSSCSIFYEYKTPVTLSVAPAAGSVFDGWSGACAGTGTCTATVDAPKSVTATFSKNPTVALSAKASGTATFSTDAITIPDNTTVDVKWVTGNSPTSCIGTSAPQITGWNGVSKSVAGDTDPNVGPLLSAQSPVTFTITCSKAGTPDVSSSVTVTIASPISVTLATNQNPVIYNTVPTLTWTTSGNPTACTASGGWSGAKSTAAGPTSEAQTALTTPATYTITCTKANATDATKSVSVGVVLAQPVLTPSTYTCASAADTGKIALAFTNKPIPGAASYNLYRNTSTNAPYTLVGNYTSTTFPSTDSGLTPATTYYYQVEAVGATGSGVQPGYSDKNANAAASNCVTPTATISSQDTTINQNDSTTITWSSTNTISCTSPNTPDFTAPGHPTSGSATVSPVTTTTYTVNCPGQSFGTATFQTTVTVVTPPLQSSCSFSPTSVDLAANQPVTWSATASGGVKPYTYQWSGNSPLNSVAPVTTNNSSINSPVTYTDTSPNFKTGHITVTDSAGTASISPDCSSGGASGVSVTNSQCNFGLVIYPITVSMSFLGTSAVSQRTNIQAFPPDCTQSITLSPASATIVDSKGKSTPVTLSYYDVGTNNPSNKVIAPGQYAVGVDMTVRAPSPIASGVYTLTITGTGSGGVVRTQDFQVNVSSAQPMFQEF